MIYSIYGASTESKLEAFAGGVRILSANSLNNSDTTYLFDFLDNHLNDVLLENSAVLFDASNQTKKTLTEIFGEKQDFILYLTKKIEKIDITLDWIADFEKEKAQLTDDVINKLTKLTAHFDTTGNNLENLKIGLRYLNNSLENNSMLHQAKYYLEKVIENTSDEHLNPYAIYYIGLIEMYYELEFDVAEKCFTVSINYATTVPDRELLSKSHYEKAKIFYLFNSFTKCIQHSKKAMEYDETNTGAVYLFVKANLCANASDHTLEAKLSDLIHNPLTLILTLFDKDYTSNSLFAKCLLDHLYEADNLISMQLSIFEESYPDAIAQGFFENEIKLLKKDIDLKTISSLSEAAGILSDLEKKVTQTMKIASAKIADLKGAFENYSRTIWEDSPTLHHFKEFIKEIEVQNKKCLIWGTEAFSYDYEDLQAEKIFNEVFLRKERAKFGDLLRKANGALPTYSEYENWKKEKMIQKNMIYIDKNLIDLDVNIYKIIENSFAILSMLAIGIEIFADKLREYLSDRKIVQNVLESGKNWSSAGQGALVIVLLVVYWLALLIVLHVIYWILLQITIRVLLPKINRGFKVYKKKFSNNKYK